MRGLGPASLLDAWERGLREAPPRRALTLLSAGMGRTADVAATVDVGSRNVILAGILESVCGGPAWALADCGECGCLLDVAVDVAAVARMPMYEPGELFETAVESVAISFRLPTEADLESLIGSERMQARRLLLSRCVRWTDGELPEAVADAVEVAMEAASPGAALGFAVKCPGCSAVTVTALDVSVFLWAEVEAQALALIQDVHALASAYGWTEADVVALSPGLRAAYIELASA